MCVFRRVYEEWIVSIVLHHTVEEKWVQRRNGEIVPTCSFPLIPPGSWTLSRPAAAACGFQPFHQGVRALSVCFGICCCCCFCFFTVPVLLFDFRRQYTCNYLSSRAVHRLYGVESLSEWKTECFREAQIEDCVHYSDWLSGTFGGPRGSSNDIMFNGMAWGGHEGSARLKCDRLIKLWGRIKWFEDTAAL